MPSVKEAYRVFWIVKGHVNVSEETALKCYDNYFKRVWYNDEAWSYVDGFEDAYNKMREKGP
jgi:hypothetical protein